MQRVNHEVSPVQIVRDECDYVLGYLLEILERFLCFEQAQHKGIHGLVGQRYRLMHTADGSCGMKDYGTLLLRIGDGVCLILLQKILHQDTVLEFAVQLSVQLPCYFERRDCEIPSHGAGNHNDLLDTQKFPVPEKTLHQIRECEDLRDHQIRDLLPLYHAVDLLLIIQVEMVDDRHARTGHVQAVQCEERLGQRYADEPYAGVVIPCKSET